MPWQLAPELPDVGYRPARRCKRPRTTTGTSFLYPAVLCFRVLWRHATLSPHGSAHMLPDAKPRPDWEPSFALITCSSLGCYRQRQHGSGCWKCSRYPLRRHMRHPNAAVEVEHLASVQAARANALTAPTPSNRAQTGIAAQSARQSVDERCTHQCAESNRPCHLPEAARHGQRCARMLAQLQRELHGTAGLLSPAAGGVGCPRASESADGKHSAPRRARRW